MRYYSIVLGGTGGSAPSGFPAVPGGGVSGATWSSQSNGQNDPGALNVELDIITSPFHVPVGGSFVRVWGIPLQQISQASQLNRKLIDVYGGMSAGLPLANPSQQGLLAHGSIFPAFGNWVETDMTLDMVLTAPFTGDGVPDTPNQPAPIVHNWQQGQPLSNAIQTALATAFPGFTLDINISSSLVLPIPDIGFYRTIEAYAGYVNSISKTVMNSKTYPGVSIAMNGKKISVYDGTASSGEDKQILFQDLIGQPTWLGLNTVQVKTAMRGDIAMGTKVMLPQTQATVAAVSQSQFRQNSSFQGKFLIQQVRHIGNLRQPDSASWVTTFDCAALDSPAG